jgi:hypothetical protein
VKVHATSDPFPIQGVSLASTWLRSQAFKLAEAPCQLAKLIRFYVFPLPEAGAAASVTEIGSIIGSIGGGGGGGAILMIIVD